jgi:putative acetyltransferase
MRRETSNLPIHMTEITVSREDPGAPDILALLMAGEAYGAALYPAESNHYLPLDALRAPEVLFLVARTADGVAIGTGAIVANDDWAEIKRMWVDPVQRGKGLSKRLLGMLEAHVSDLGIRTVRLETGIHNTEALGLYERMGYLVRDAFAPYAPDPLSVFMEKQLPARNGK